MAFAEPFQLPPEFRQQPLSARVLEDYALCPRKFLLSFFVGRDEARHFRGGPAALHDAVRQALVDCYDQGGPPACSVPVLLDSFEAHWQGDLCADTMEEEQLHKQGLQMLRDYHADHQADAVEIIATDQRFEGTIEGQAFVAVADLVLRDAAEPSTSGFQPREPALDDSRSGFQPRPLRVIRFVTSRRPLTPDELTEDLSAQLLWLLARDHYRVGAAPERVGRDILDRPEVRVLFASLRKRDTREAILTPEREAYARRDLASRAARLYRESEFTPVKGDYCRWCRVRRRCPLWQR